MGTAGKATWALIALLAGVAGGPRTAAAIPVFARIYDKPCGACHTVFPQLNPFGERFRAQGLHGIPPAVKPLRVTSWLDVPGTLPAALTLGVGEDLSRRRSGTNLGDTQEHFNLEILALVAGGELGPHLAFLADYAPLMHNTQTGALRKSTRIGLGFLQAHARPWGWLANFRAGLIELPLGTSPRVHRLTTQPYLLYGLTAFSLLGVSPPVAGGRTDSLNLSQTQIAAEVSGLEPDGGQEFALGVTTGSNNRKDNNSSKDVFLHLGQHFGLHRAGGARRRRALLPRFRRLDCRPEPVGGGHGQR
jgi:hypothetical protein